jgi:hypothetical protein
MMTFGQTWWGEKWLSALSRIDFSNRLPRGRAYARNGSVKDINFAKNRISAKVKGSSPSPYRVSIVVPGLQPSQKEFLIGNILKNLFILSRLLNRDLPKDLYRLAQDNDIPLFPNSWKDLSMECSCPDFAVPCKHIAAVIYIISSEIDKNPFLIFQLKGLDILKELENSGFVGQSGIRIPKSSERLIKHPENRSNTDVCYHSPNFSHIPFLADDLISLLKEKPLFSAKDYRLLLKKQYDLAAKNTRKLLESSQTNEENISELEQYQEVEMILDEDCLFDRFVLRSDREEKSFSQPRELNAFLNLIATIPAKYAERLPTGLRIIHDIYQFCIKVLEQGAFIPQLTALIRESYIIRWIPATINGEVEKAVKELSMIIPPGMVISKHKGAAHLFLNNYEQVMSISGLMINFLLIPSSPIKTYSLSSHETNVDILFFGRMPRRFIAMGESEIPGSINQWLSGFYLAHKTYVPLLKVAIMDINRFTIDILLENREDIMAEPVSFSSFMQEEKYTGVRAEVLHSLARLAREIPDLATLISTRGRWKPDYGPDEFARMLATILPVIRLLGVSILLPQELKDLVRPRPTLLLSMKGQTGKRESFLNLDQVMEFDWQVALGDLSLPLEEFVKLVRGLSGVVRIRGKYILIDQDEILKMLSSLRDDHVLSSHDLLRAALTEEYMEAKITLSTEAKRLIKSMMQVKTIELPQGIRAELRPYQQRGWQWLYRNARAGFGSIIADDMGLGKTLQVITLLMQFKAEGRFRDQSGLIIVPTTLLTNWQKEIERFAPSLQSCIYHGTGRRLPEDELDVLITSYGMLRSDLELLGRKKWAVVVIDEAQNIKNPGTEQAKAVKKLKTPVRIAMSGTPVENRLSEYWSIFDFTNKGYLGSLKYFREEMANSIEMFRDELKLEKFRKITSPFILRRLKTDKSIISDLPEKIENDRFVTLTKEQAAIYENVVQSMIPGIEEEESGSFNRAGMIFKMMTALKQICNHPSHFLKKEDINPDLSGKASMLLEILESIYENDEKVLIFTQYKEMGDLLVKMIEDHFGNKTLFLHGSVSLKRRHELVTDFQEKKQFKTFILSIKAGGTGLNLTAANHVIHYDLWWNPAVETQATDRAFRIGQHKNVMVYRLISQGTFEEKINEMIQSKKDLANLTVTAGEKWIGELSNQELLEMVKL